MMFASVADLKADTGPGLHAHEQVKGGIALPGLLHDWVHLSGWAADATGVYR
jgi:hypothetical protein